MIEEQVKLELEAPAWSTAQTALATDVACLTGTGDCPGEKRGMTLVDVSDADVTTAREILVSTVLPDWAERAGGDWGARWNDTVGKTTGVEIELK